MVRSTKKPVHGKRYEGHKLTDFLDQKRREIDTRLKELKPLVDEYARLQAAAEALNGVGGATTATAPATRTRRTGTGKAATRTRRKTATGRPRGAGRPKGSGKRAAQANKYVNAQPGITIPELAAKMGIKQNYLYRALPGLEEEKKVRKDGRGWYPVG
jgi:hypothetical protein